MKEIRIFPDATQKYILAENNEGARFLWGNPNIKWHKEIKAEMDLEDIQITHVLGGGKLIILTKEELIYVWGTSTVYGDVSLERVKSLLEREYKRYEIINEEYPEEQS